MLKRLLMLIDEGSETQSVQSLARVMNVPPPLVEEMLQRLGREGYLICVSPSTGPTECGICPVSAYCGGQHPGLWQLTEKARTLLATPQASGI